MRGCLFFFLLISAIFGENIDAIKKAIQKEYVEFYKDNHLKIKSIQLELSPSTQINEVAIQKISLNDRNFSSNGKVLIHFTFNKNKYSHLIKYKIQATLDVLFSQVGIKKAQEITRQNTMERNIDLEDLSAVPMSFKDIDNVSAKIFIPNQTIIYGYHIEPKILIKKNDTFLAIYKDGNITIQLILVAKENGSKDSIIEAFNPETKKSVKVKVLSNGNGEVL